MSDGKLDATDFEATVVCMDWIVYVDGSMYRGFRGKVTVMSAEEAVGFVPTGHNSANWIVRVKGPNSAITLMGCQVRAIVEDFSCHRDFLVMP